MKTFIVLALIFTTVSSSFLRELTGETSTPTAVTVSTITFNVTCTTGDNVALTAATNQNSFTGTPTPSFNATLTSGVEKNDITMKDGVITGGSIAWTLTSSTAELGVYKVKSIIDTAATAAYTFTLPTPNTAAVTISVAATHNTTQEETQEIEEGKSFNVQFNEALTKAPLIYSGINATTPIADCKVDTDDTKKVMCKPTGDEMEKETEYTIHYKAGCPETLTATKVKVKFTPKDGSAFITFGKIALFAMALLF